MEFEGNFKSIDLDCFPGDKNIPQYSYCQCEWQNRESYYQHKLR